MNYPNRMVWCDAIRLLAFFMLLCCHAADPFYAAAAYASSGSSLDPELVQWGVRWGSLVRPCVPLFVMLTGVLSLPVKGSMESFYKKRIPRVFFPFLIWSVLYYFTPWFTGLLGLDSSVVIKLFSWAESDSQALSDGLVNVARIPYAFSFIACHMWYIYMLIGLYLYLPIFSAWVEKATRCQKEIVLGLWVLSTFLPYFNEYVSKYAFGTCEWNSFGLFYYFAGFNGYMLLGHYIQHYINWSWTKALGIALPLLVGGFLITYSGYNYIMELPDKTPEQVELFWTYNTPNVAMMTVACFLLVYRIRIKAESRIATWLASLTTCGFGIYMIHYYFVCVGYDLGEWLHIPAPLRIPFSALVILACSWLIVFLVKKALGKRSVYLLG
ncbi:MAG: acyltransferase family protein [Bacteroides sp.]|nr:acyltransferase family protein [Bacteroides sp.]